MLYVFIPALNCSLAKMSTSVNGTSMDSKICTHVFENPHLGADFVPFMNKTTLFSETHLSICVLSSGPRVAFAGRAKLRAVFFFFWVVEWKSPRRRNEEDDDVVDDDDDDDAREVVALKGVVAKLLIVNDDGTFFFVREESFYKCGPPPVFSPQSSKKTLFLRRGHTHTKKRKKTH